jgi:hypothetical protein
MPRGDSPGFPWVIASRSISPVDRDVGERIARGDDLPWRLRTIEEVRAGKYDQPREVGRTTPGQGSAERPGLAPPVLRTQPRRERTPMPERAGARGLAASGFHAGAGTYSPARAPASGAHALLGEHDPLHPAGQIASSLRRVCRA